MIAANFKISILGLMFLTLAGCFGSPAAVPEDHFYVLSKVPASKLEQKYQTIAIETLHANGIYNERAWLYTDQKNPLEIKRYHYHHWAMSPPRLIKQHLKDYLHETGIAKNIVDYNPPENVDIVIKGTLLQFERILGNGKVRIKVQLELEVENNTGKTISHEYGQIVNADNGSFPASAQAFSKALGLIYKQFVADIS